MRVVEVLFLKIYIYILKTKNLNNKKITILFYININTLTDHTILSYRRYFWIDDILLHESSEKTDRDFT